MNRIRELREAAGMTQGELAARVEVARQTILAIEKGRYDPGLSLAFRISAVFGRSVDEVFKPK
ncbi:MAG: helix-turn-helix transcriptional regulator [Parvularculaceae bacterium]